MLEFADVLDTDAFNAVDRSADLQQHTARFRDALGPIMAGLNSGDDRLIGQGATENALAYQEVLPKPQIPSVLALARAADATGVNVAHRVTVLGLFFPDDEERAAWGLPRRLGSDCRA